MSKSDILGDNELWAAAAGIAEYAYSVLSELPEEEKWDMASALRRHAFDLTDDISEAIGSSDPRDSAHYLGHAVRDAYGIKNALTMAKRAGYIRPTPEIMLAIEELVPKMRHQSDEAATRIPDYLKQFEAAEEQRSNP